MSSRGHSVPPAPVVVKKTRPTATTAKAARAPKKAPTGDLPKPLGSTAPQSTSTISNSSVATSTPATEIDSLTSGMKKVSITLTTQAQRAARAAKDKATADTKTSGKPPAAKPATRSSPKKTTAPRKVAAPKTTGAKTELSQGAVEIPESPAASFSAPSVSNDPISSSATPIVAAAPIPGSESINSPSVDPSVRVASGTPELSHSHPTSAQTPSSLPLPPSLPNTPQRPTHAAMPPPPPSPPPQAPSPPSTAASSGGSNVFIPYQPEGPTPNVDVTRNGPGLTWLEPNASTPARHKTSGNSPSAIVSAETGQASSAATGAPAQKQSLPVFSSTGIIPFGVKMKAVKEQGDSIWDVPDTPRG